MKALQGNRSNYPGRGAGKNKQGGRKIAFYQGKTVPEIRKEGVKVVIEQQKKQRRGGISYLPS